MEWFILAAAIVCHVFAMFLTIGWGAGIEKGAPTNMLWASMIFIVVVSILSILLYCAAVAA